MKFVGVTLVTLTGVAVLTVNMPAIALAASSPSVSATGRPGSITVDFDFTDVEVSAGVTCLTYVTTRQSGLDAAEPSGRADAQAPGSTFSIENTDTSAVTYAENDAPVQVEPQPIDVGTYYVYWGCRDAGGVQWDNIGLDTGAPFQTPIVVDIVDDDAAPAPTPGTTPGQPLGSAVPNGAGTGSATDVEAIDTPEELRDHVVALLGDVLPGSRG